MPESRRGATTATATPARTPERRPITRTFWPPSDWSVRRKVIACLALPLIFATVLVGIRIAGAWGDSQAASRAENRYQVLQPAIDYLASSQDLSAELVTSSADKEKVATARAQFHQSRETLTSALNSSGLSSHQRSLLNDAVTTGKNLDGATDTTTARSAASLAPGAISSDVLAFVDDLNTAHPEATLSTLHDLVTAQSHLADQRLELASGGTLSNSLRTQLSADIGGERDALERVQAVHVSGVDVSKQQSDTVSRLTFSTTGTLSQLNSVTKSVTSSYQSAYKAAVTAATERVGSQASDARRSALLQIALVIALLALTWLAAYFLSRWLLLRPIAGLRRSTIDASERHLPAAIDRVQSGRGVGRIQSVALTSREEIGQLSRAVDDMQNRAIRLASEQATLRRQMTDMFETLSRRSTSLVNQQLNLLDQLERTEDDPKRLDSLFRLDHVAARMRRNGQSLMVLAGSEAARGGRAVSLPLDQVIGAAVSEVQDYQRVDIGGLPEHIVTEEAATDLVHVVAELVDNALSYSPPDTRVQVSGTRAIDGGVLLEIEDHGLGIEQDELAQLNDDISAGGRFGVETTRHMGLFVVARLSAGHTIEVRLRSRPQRGTVAAVHVPVTVLSTEPDAENGDVVTRDTASTVAAHETAAAAPVASATSTPAAEREPLRAVEVQEQTSTGLPRRRPGATGVTALSGTNSLGTAAAASGMTGPATPAGEWVSPVGEAPTPDPGRAANASAFFSARQSVAAEDRASSSGLPQRQPGATRSPSAEPVEAAEPTQPAEPTRPTPRRPEDTPIFQQISSRWLDADGQGWAPWSSEPTDQAWEAAQVATEEHSSGDGALPRREPGRYAVPGSVEQASERPARDPAALRDKLSRYKASVERAREASTDNDTHNESRTW